MDNRGLLYSGLKNQTFIVLLNGLLALVYFSTMSRLLTKEDFGYYAIIAAVTAVLGEITNAGLGASVIQRKDFSLKYFQTALSLSFIIGTITSVLLYFLASYLSLLILKTNALELPFKIISFTLLLNNVISVVRALYMKKFNFFIYGINSVVAYLFSYMVGVFMAYKGMGVYSIVIALLVYSLLLFIFLIVQNRKYISFYVKGEYVGSILSYGGWLTASGIVRSIYDQLDKLITNRWIPVSALGAYNRPSGFISQVSGQINGIFDTILFPILSGIQNDKEKVKHSYKKATSLIIISSSILSCLAILSSSVLTAIFLGEQWSDLVPLLKIFSFSMIFLFYSRIADCFFRSLGIVKLYFNVRMVVCFVSIFIIILGCQYGIYGLALSTVVVRFFDSFVKMLVLRRVTSVKLIELLVPCMTPILVLCAIFLFCHLCLFFLPSIWDGIISSALFILILILGLFVDTSFLGCDFEEFVIKKYIKK